MLTIFDSGFVQGAEHAALGDYAYSRGCIEENIVIENGQQRVFEDSSFGPTQLRSFSVVLIRGDDHSC